MAERILVRCVWSIPVIVLVSLFTFVVMHLIPGNPWDLRHAKFAAAGAEQALAQRYGQNKSLIRQYLDYMQQAALLDFGPSYSSTLTVNQIIAQEFPLSARLGIAALLLSLLGIPSGLLMARNHDSLLDRLWLSAVTVLVSIPGFVLGILAMYLLCVKLKVVPLFFQVDRWQSWLLPCFLLSLGPYALLTRYARSAALEIIHQDHVMVAKAKGVPEYLISYRHIFRVALMPIVTLFGPLIADLVTGSFIVERLFQVPGIAHEYIDSIVNRDYALMMTVTLLFAVLIILCNLLVDLIYMMIDPRLRHV